MSASTEHYTCPSKDTAKIEMKYNKIVKFVKYKENKLKIVDAPSSNI